ncbi:protein MIZU-KUSSEI 1-like [Hibiscus syriacus]|uniref:protein MIZU-KUSSEI 1-like n=1 Tax=Hibiscus syriacus TaxID=106335 RepID=UPI001924E907|nr:protein MIZU-KUSSEI 1-like [Hibiscus syriacus]
MTYVHSSPYFQMDNPAILSLLRPTPKEKHRKSSSTGGGSLLRMFKLFPMLTSGCKMVALLGKPQKPFLKDGTTTGTIFGYRKGRVWLAIQADPYRMPMFLIELPMLTGVLQKEMGSDIVRIALESETRTHKKKLFEEFVWAVYCNGRKMGYSIRRKQVCEDELQVMQLLRGVSMGAGVLPSPNDKKDGANGELTYMRATFERVVGSKDSQTLYMINPDGAPSPELSIFFIRGH